MELAKFSRLEEKIKRLLEDYSLLKKRNEELEELIRQKDSELENATHEVRRLNEERDAVRGKVDSLLDILKDIGVSH